ncbi:MAG TPA: TetR/AcrR family transcriptional regulator [Pseudonocardiaceae bacterium]|nr:TetR/AcrR family transcriptional regulator [Pseudonocardiaceae bacterium]
MPRIPAEQRRAELVAAAWRVMAAEGVAAATTRAIVAEAGMPLGAFHYCFRDKAELFHELVRHTVTEDLAAAMAPLKVTTDVRKALRDSLRGLWQRMTADRDRQLVLNELTAFSLRDPALVELQVWKYQQYLDGATRYFETLAERAGVSWGIPTALVGRMFVAVLGGASDTWLVTGDSAGGWQMLRAFATALAAQTRPLAPGRRTA